MDVSEILEKLARCNQLASQTHKRALTHSLLNQALDKCRPHSHSGYNKSLNSDSQPPSQLLAADHDSFKQQYSYCRCCERQEAPAADHDSFKQQSSYCRCCERQKAPATDHDSFKQQSSYCRCCERQKAPAEDEQEEPNFRCKDCPRRLGSSTSHSQSEEHSFGCKDCPRRLGSSTSHSQSEEHSFGCKNCPRRLGSPTSHFTEDGHDWQYREYPKKLGHSGISSKEDFNLGSNVSPRRLKSPTLGAKEARSSPGCDECAPRQNSPSSGTRPVNSRFAKLDADKNEDIHDQHHWRNSHTRDYQHVGKDNYPRPEGLVQSFCTSERQGSKDHESGLGESKGLFHKRNHRPDITSKDNFKLAENRSNFLIDDKVDRRIISRLDEVKSAGCSCITKGLENKENILVDTAMFEKYRFVDKERSEQLLRRNSFKSSMLNQSPETSICEDHEKQGSLSLKNSNFHQRMQHQDSGTGLTTGSCGSQVNLNQPFTNVSNGSDWLARKQDLRSTLTSKKLSTSAKDGFDHQVSPSQKSQRSPRELSGYNDYISKNYDLSRMEARDGISQCQGSPNRREFSNKTWIDGQKNIKDKHESGKKDGGCSIDLCNERVLFEHQTGFLQGEHPQRNLFDQECKQCSPGQYFNQSNDVHNHQSQEKRRSESSHHLIRENYEDQRQHTSFSQRHRADQLEFPNFTEKNKKSPGHRQLLGINGYDSSELKTISSQQFVLVPSTMQMKENVWSHGNIRDGSQSKNIAIKDSKSRDAEIQPDIYLRINSQLTSEKQQSRRLIVDDQNWTAIKGLQDEGKDQEMSIKIRSQESERNVGRQDSTVNDDRIGRIRTSLQNERNDQGLKTRAGSQQNKQASVGLVSKKIIVARQQESQRVTLSDNSDSDEQNTHLTSEHNLIKDPGSREDLSDQLEKRLERQNKVKSVAGPKKSEQAEEGHQIKRVSPHQLETQKTHSSQFHQHSHLNVQTEEEKRDMTNLANEPDSEEDDSDRQIYQKSSHIRKEGAEEVFEQQSVKPQPNLKDSLNPRDTTKIYQQEMVKVYQKEPKGSENRRREFGQSFHGTETSKLEESRYGDGSTRNEFNKNVEQKYQESNTHLLETRRDNKVNTGCSRCGSRWVQGKAELSPSAPVDSEESEICPCYGTVNKKTALMVGVSDDSFRKDGTKKFGMERWAKPLGRSYKDETVERCHCGQILPKEPAHYDGQPQRFMEWQPGRSSNQWQVRRTSYQQRFGQGSDCLCCSKSRYSHRCTKCQLYRSNPSLQPTRRTISSEHSDRHQQGSTKDGHCGMLQKSQIESTMIQMGELMNNISHLCECYYDECPPDSLTAADRKHLRTFHRGVLPCKTSKLDKKFCKLKEQRDSPCSSSYQGPEPSLDEPQKSFTSAAPARSSSFHSRQSQPMKEDRSQLSVRFSDTCFISEDHPGENQKSTQSSKAADSTITQFESSSRTHSDDSDCHWPLADTQVYSRHNVDPVNMTQSNQAEPDDLISQPICDRLLISHSGSTKSSKPVSSDQKPWTSESKNKNLSLSKTQTGASGLFVEGVSAFPTQKSSVLSKKIRRGKQLAKPDSDQGICIVTQPGSYIVRRPQEESSVHLLQVNPGNFIKLKI